MTPEEKRAYSRAWYAAHREQRLAENRAYRASHREERRIYHASVRDKRHANYRANKGVILAGNRAYRLAHNEEINAKRRDKYANSPSSIRKRNSLWSQMNRLKRNAYKRKYNKKHPGANQAHNAKRRALKSGAPHNDFTAKQWHRMKDAYGHRCVYCGKKPQRLTQDHITPLIKGGSHTASNIVPACRACNGKKATGPPLIPVQPLLLL